MNLEGLTINFLTAYLRQTLLNSKIYKIFMPSKNSLLLFLKKEKSTVYLLADFSQAAPFLYITSDIPDRPEIPPAFCMLLRKHLEEGRITKIEQQDLDRIISFEISSVGASRQIITKHLIFELTGKNSNIIFTQDGIIIDSLKHINKSMNSYRQIMPGVEYMLPPTQSGHNILSSSPETIVDATARNLQNSVLKSLVASTTGIGNYTATELLKLAQINPSATALSDYEKTNLTNVIKNMQADINGCDKATAPVYAIFGAIGTVKTVLTVKPTNTENLSVKAFAGINDAISYAAKLKPLQLPEQELLKKTVSGELNRLEKKLILLHEDLAKADNAEDERIIADSLMASLYLVPKGATECVITNIYDGSEISVKLSPILTPAANAQNYYKRYNKFKRAQTELKEQIEITKENIEYLSSIDVSLTTATSKAEFAEIKSELTSLGLFKAQNKKNAGNIAKSQPTMLKLADDVTIYIGKNNKQNDFVTFGIGQANDLWFHTKNIPGSHVILKTTSPEFAEEHIQIAANLAAYYSKSKNGSNVPIDCTLRKFVKKPSGAKPGFVIYTNQKTYYATPNEDLINEILYRKN